MDTIILAAGQGLRLREQHTLPKGFICISNNTLIEESIKILRYYGINKILIVTGYQADCYQTLQRKFDDIQLVYNSEYSQSGSLYSWFLAKDFIKHDFLLLESDIVYSEHIIRKLLDTPYSDSILVSEVSGIHDAVFIEAEDNFLVNMDKNPDHLEAIFGELVGISKISYSSAYLLFKHVEEDIEKYKKYNYETDGLVWLSKYKSIYCEKIPKFLCCEIDDLKHLHKARELYPQLRRETSIFTKLLEKEYHENR